MLSSNEVSMQTDDCIPSLIRMLGDGRVGLLCGAGISIPAGLPSAMALASRICVLICPREESRRILIDEVCNRHHIPFEGFIETILHVSGNSTFLEMFSAGRPATAHILAAHLAGHGAVKTIVTTNFDALFERAFAEKGLPPEAWNLFSTDRDFDELTRAAMDAPRLSLLKVHGSYGAGAAGMVTTLRQLGQRRLLDDRMKAIDYLFREGPHDVVLILGYSCSDVFDINVRIQSLGSAVNKTVILLQHALSSEPQISQLNTCPEYPVFADSNDDSLLVRVNTNVFLREAMQQLSVAEPMHQGSPDLWSRYVDRWFTEVEASVDDRIVAAIFRRCGIYDLAASHYEAAIETLKHLQEFEIMGDVTTQLGALRQIQGAYDSALNSYKHALDLVSTKPSRIRSTALYQIGRVKEEIGDYRAALAKYEESMEIDRLLGDRSGMASCFHQTGILYQEYLHDADEAELRYRRSLGIKWEIGDLEGVFNTLHQLSTLELIRDRLEAALALNEEALALALKLSLKHSIAYARSHRGYVFQKMGRLKEAESECRQSLSIREDLKDIKGMSRCYHRLGEIERLRGSMRPALHLMAQALRLKVSIGDRFGVAEDTLQIGVILGLAGHLAWSQKARKAARGLFLELGCDKEADACEAEAVAG